MIGSLRVRRPEEFDLLLLSLGGPAKNIEKPFDSLKSVMIFAAALAFKKGLPPEEFEKSGERIPFAYFSGELERSFIAALAVRESDDISIIHPERLPDQLTIFEKYACAGLRELSKAYEEVDDFDSYLLSLCATSITDDSIVDEIFDEFSG